MFSSHQAHDAATAVLERLDTDRLEDLVHHAVSEVPGELKAAASRAAGSLTDQASALIPTRRAQRTRRVAVVAVITAIVAVAVGVAIARRQRTSEVTMPDDQRRPGAANPN